jgi:hypothetical protein
MVSIPRRAAAVVAALAIVALAPGIALASWSKNVTVAGTAKATSLGLPDTVTVATSGTTATTMTVTSTTPTGGPTPDSYQVDRGAPAATICPPAANPCLDAGRTANTSYSYTVKSKLNSWAGSATPAIPAKLQNTALYPTGLQIANGTGTDNFPDAGDTIVITLSAAPTAASICGSAGGWTSLATTLTGVLVTMSDGNGGGVNNIDFSRTGCTGPTLTAGLGTLPIGASTKAFITKNGAVTWPNSTLAWNGTTKQLTLTLGTCSANCGNLNGAASGEYYQYTPGGSMTTGAATASGTATEYGGLF